jgi:hypothetical protein
MKEELIGENIKFDYFACVVDGEFTGAVGVSYNMPALVAGMNSNPTIIPITKEQAFELRLGTIWDGKEFKLAKE